MQPALTETTRAPHGPASRSAAFVAVVEKARALVELGRVVMEVPDLSERVGAWRTLLSWIDSPTRFEGLSEDEVSEIEVGGTEGAVLKAWSLLARSISEMPAETIAAAAGKLEVVRREFVDHDEIERMLDHLLKDLRRLADPEAAASDFDDATASATSPDADQHLIKIAAQIEAVADREAEFDADRSLSARERDEALDAADEEGDRLFAASEALRPTTMAGLAAKARIAAWAAGVDIENPLDETDPESGNREWRAQRGLLAACLTMPPVEVEPSIETIVAEQIDWFAPFFAPGALTLPTGAEFAPFLSAPNELPRAAAELYVAGLVAARIVAEAGEEGAGGDAGVVERLEGRRDPGEFQRLTTALRGALYIVSDLEEDLVESLATLIGGNIAMAGPGSNRLHERLAERVGR